MEAIKFNKEIKIMTKIEFTLLLKTFKYLLENDDKEALLKIINEAIEEDKKSD